MRALKRILAHDGESESGTPFLLTDNVEVCLIRSNLANKYIR